MRIADTWVGTGLDVCASDTGLMQVSIANYVLWSALHGVIALSGCSEASAIAVSKRNNGSGWDTNRRCPFFVGSARGVQL